MSTLIIPDEWTHFQSNWDAYRGVYETFCIFDGHWYKGLGVTREEGLARLHVQIAEGRKGSQLLEPSRYLAQPGAYRKAHHPILRARPWRHYTMSKITSLSISNYYSSGPTGSFTLVADGFSATIDLDREDCERIFSVLNDAVARKRDTMAQAVRDIELPALLGYDRDKTIEVA